MPDAGSASVLRDVDKTAPADLAAIAREAAEAGARAAMSWLDRARGLRVEEKAAPDDLVSQADHDAERAIRAVLAERRPGDAVLGEEAGEEAGRATGRSAVRWIVDPIDGTTNYLYGRPDWAVSVAAARVTDRRLLAGVVIEPILGRTTQAWYGGGTYADGTRVAPLRQRDLVRTLVELNLGRGPQRALAGRMIDVLRPRVRDVRRGGSAAAALAQLVTGRTDAVWAPGLRAWDCAAGALLVHEAGGVVGDLAGPSPGTWPASGDVLAAPPALWEPLRHLLTDVYPAVSPSRPNSTPTG